jgi:hypothetical protein
VSSFLHPNEVRALEPWFDYLHQPFHDEDGYRNFRLFCIRDLHRVVTAPHFIKIDTDVELADDWIEYVDETLTTYPELILFGPHGGTRKLDYDISGPFVQRRLGRPVKVRAGLKVNGSFYVGQTAFFQEHDEAMQGIHECLYQFRDGRRVRTSLSRIPEEERDESGAELVRLRGSCRGKQGSCSEDELRSLTVHFVGASLQMRVRDSEGRVCVPDKRIAPSAFKLAMKELKCRLGVRSYDRARYAP